jgi:putative transposase
MSQSRRAYSTDLTDQEWQILEPLLPAEKTGGRHRLYEMREIINALRYLLRTGCAWRLLPHDFPHWRAVYEYFRIWKQDGTWLKIHDFLHAELRAKMKREKQPSAAIVDSQSVKTTEKGGRKEATTARRKSQAENAT